MSTAGWLIIGFTVLVLGAIVASILDRYWQHKENMAEIWNTKNENDTSGTSR